MNTNLNTNQQQLLEKINQYSEASRRTDRLAVCMKQFGSVWDNSHVAYVGLQLRALGFATTYKDQGLYARWDITPKGKAVLCEIHNMAKRIALAEVNVCGGMKKNAAVADKPPQYAVYCSEDSGFKRCASKEEAEELAVKWAKETDGEEVFVVQVIKTLKSKVVVEEA